MEITLHKCNFLGCKSVSCLVMAMYPFEFHPLSPWLQFFTYWWIHPHCCRWFVFLPLTITQYNWFEIGSGACDCDILDMFSSWEINEVGLPYQSTSQQSLLCYYTDYSARLPSACISEYCQLVLRSWMAVLGPAELGAFKPVISFKLAVMSWCFNLTPIRKLVSTCDKHRNSAID